MLGIGDGLGPYVPDQDGLWRAITPPVLFLHIQAVGKIIELFHILLLRFFLFFLLLMLNTLFF